MKNKLKDNILTAILLVSLAFSSFSLFYSVSTYISIRDTSEKIITDLNQIGDWNKGTTVTCYDSETYVKVACDK